MRLLGLIAALLTVTPAAAALEAAEAPEAGMPRGQQVFYDKCIHCHDARGWGTRVLARRTPAGEAELTHRRNLPAAYTVAVVRRGLGSMPAFNPTELSDADLAAVATWLAEGTYRAGE